MKQQRTMTADIGSKKLANSFLTNQKVKANAPVKEMENVQIAFTRRIKQNFTNERKRKK